MFLMSRKIKALGVKMVLSGEGSDEVFGGYLYFHKAPNRVRGARLTRLDLRLTLTSAILSVPTRSTLGKPTQPPPNRPQNQPQPTPTDPNLTPADPNLTPISPPLQDEFFQETVRKVQALYQFDCLRANKSTMAWGVEARVPFLDRAFLDLAMAIDPREKMIDKKAGRIEKYILRKVGGFLVGSWVGAEGVGAGGRAAG
jgi:asparagine synthetase B (glutamine-hydrolysing)